MMKNVPLIAALVVWLACLAVGFDLSQRRPLWNDEIYTQTRSVDPMPYITILQGRIPEGNNSPLFYVLQKSICDAAHYRFPWPWQGEWFVYEPRSQVVMRLLSNVFMSTAIALIFYFFAGFYGLAIGAFALAAVLAAPAVWMYWTDARPYALWFFLTAVQSLIFLRLLDHRNPFPRGWLLLALIHCSLALTVSLGSAQVFVVSALLFLFKEKRWQRYIFLTGVPLLIGVFYYLCAPKYNFWFREGPWELLCQNVPPEYLIISLLCAAAVVFRKGQAKDGRSGKYFLLAGSMALIAVALLGFLQWKAGLPTAGFAISSRYFIFLVPVAIVALTLCVSDLWYAFKNDPWMRTNVLIVILGILALRVVKTYITVMASGIFMHVIR